MMKEHEGLLRRGTQTLLIASLLVGAFATAQPIAAGAEFAAALPSATPSAQGPGQRAVAPGVVYSAYTIAGPNKIKIVTIDPEVATIDVALASPQMPGWSKTSSMAASHDAVAAINGDFGLSPGRPAHFFAEDGAMVQTSILGVDGKNFAVEEDGTAAWADNPQVRITATHLGKTLTIDNWNEGAPKATEISAFSAEGGSIEKPGSGCGVRLQSAGVPFWSPGRSSVERNFTVSTVQCGSALAVSGGVVLVAPSGTANGNNIKAMRAGDVIKLSWGLGWHGVMDAIGGSPVLLQNGNVKVTACSDYLCKRHPRTAVGVKANGDVMFFQVDGRSSTSIGLTLVGLAKEMKNRGAVDAINLDGGGSSTMWVKGSGIVNKPSDGSERSVSSALLVLSKPDSGDPGSLTSQPALVGAAVLDAVMHPGAGLADMQAALADPGSTGGLLDYFEARSDATSGG